MVPSPRVIWDGIFQLRGRQPNPPADLEIFEGVITQHPEYAGMIDVGCGSAETISELARRHPRIRFLGVDASGYIIRQDRRKARNLPNVRFRNDLLPKLGRVQDRYEIVSCMHTLHYVGQIEYALKRLFRLVESGGVLIFNYPNRFYYFDRRRALTLKDPSAAQNREYVLNRAAFEPLLSRRNLLTIRKIGRVLDRAPIRLRRFSVYNIVLAVTNRRNMRAS